MSERGQNIANKFGYRRLFVPVLIGLIVSVFLLIGNLNEVNFVETSVGEGDYSWVDSNNNGIVDAQIENEFVEESQGNYLKLTYREAIRRIDWKGESLFWMVISIAMIFIRDIAYILRIRILTDRQLSWKQSFHVVMMWEFASSLTPSVVGGTGVALFIVNREGISLGKTTAIVMITAMLDNLFYLLMVPMVFLLVDRSSLFPFEDGVLFEFFGYEVQGLTLFWTGYGLILVLTIFMASAVFLLPKYVETFLAWLSKITFFKKWDKKLLKAGTDLRITSFEMRGKPYQYWLKAFGATLFSWTARYWMVNFLIMAVITTSLDDHLMIYARQLVMWVIMLISPTPGSSGIAELAFSGFLKEFIPIGLAGTLAVLWRLLSYYPYLFVGSIILPRWLKRTSNLTNNRN